MVGNTRFTAFKATGRELLCKKFFNAVDVNKTRALSHVHPQRSFFRRNALYMQSRLRSVLARLKSGIHSEQSKKWAALHFSEADDDRLWALADVEAHRNYEPRRTWKLIATIPKQFSQVGPDHGERNRYLFLSSGRLLVTWARTAATQICHWPWQPERKSTVCCWDCCLEEWRRRIWRIWRCYSQCLMYWWELRSVTLCGTWKVLWQLVSIQTKSGKENQAAKLLAMQKERFSWVHIKVQGHAYVGVKNNLKTIMKSPCTRGSFCDRQKM